jgi:hypothetical protein
LVTWLPGEVIFQAAPALILDSVVVRRQYV